MSAYHQLRDRIASLHRLLTQERAEHAARQGALLGEALDALEMEFGTIGWFEGGTLVPKVWLSRTDAIPIAEPTPLEETLTGYLLGGRARTVAYANLLDDPELAGHHQVAEMGLRAFIATRTRIGNRTYFFTTGSETTRSVPFSEDDKVFIELLAALFAASLHDEQQQLEIERVTKHCKLTSYPLTAVLTEHVERLIQNESPFGLFAIDIDVSRLIDEYGQLATARIVAAVAHRLRVLLSESLRIYRPYESDFMILAENMRGTGDADALAHRVRAMLSVPVEDEGREIYVSPTIGIALHPQEGRSSEELVHQAISVMQESARQGRNLIGFSFALIADSLDRRRKLIRELRNAIERQELRLHFQPYVHLASGRTEGVEALIRWQSSSLGLLSPSEFMPLAEEADVIIPLGAWVMREAARLAKQLQNGEASLTVAFNVAAPQFADPAFLDRLDMALDETGANPANLEMEITESVAIADPAKAKRLLSEVRARGLSIALDDFGTGFSSLTHLREFPVDVVKIDRSFITTLPEAEESALITSLTW